MEATQSKKRTILKGGEFILRESSWEETFIPEQVTEEQKMYRETVRDFIKTEIDPVLDRLDAQEEGLLVAKLDKAAELGLLGLSIPPEYGGHGLDFISSAFVGEAFGGAHGFSVTLGAHTGIGTLPILYYGT